MTTKLRPQISDYCHLEPLPDPPKKIDMQQDPRIYDFRRILDLHLSHRDDVLIAGGGYLRQRAGDESERFVPDCVVAFDVNPPGIVARNGYVIEEVGKPPDLVLEVASRSTRRRDYTVKRDGYAQYGVGEYWRFDHARGPSRIPLAGDILVGGQYEPLPVNTDPDGLIWGYSLALDVEICWDNGEVQLRDHYTKEFLPRPRQERRMRYAAEARADQAEARAEDAEARAEDAEARRDAAEARRAEEHHARLSAEERIRQLEAKIQQQQNS